jgi:uncharacterized iron-regulated protein
MITRRRAILALGSLAALPACTFPPFPPARILDVRAGRSVDEEALLHALRPARYRLLGEIHDNPAHHAIRARLVDALGRSGLKPVVAFEQFDAMHDPALQRLFLEGKPTAESVADAVRFEREAWNWDFYRPIVEAALRHGMPLRAANLSRGETMRIAKEARSSPPHAAWTPERQKALEKLIVEGHCNALPDRAIPGMVAAQRARDARLAQALLDAPKDGAILIAGNGHVRNDLGVPLYLPAGEALSVGFLEDEARKAPFDYAWFTARTERPDPCETFRKK